MTERPLVAVKGSALDERLGLAKLIEEHLSDSRQGLNKKFPLADLLRQSVYSRLAGYEDLNDAVRVSADPTFRLIGSQKNWDRGGALTSRLQSFETEILAMRACPSHLWVMRKGLSIGDGKTATVRDLLALVEEDYRRKGRRTLERLDSRLKRLRSEVGSLPAPLLTTERVESYIRRLQDLGLKNATINRDLETLRRAFRLAAKRRPPLVTSELPIELLPQNNERNADVTPEEYRGLLEFLAKRDPAVRLMTVIAYHIGWRAEPIRSLRKLQLDFEAMMIHRPVQQAANKKVGTAPSTAA